MTESKRCLKMRKLKKGIYRDLGPGQGDFKVDLAGWGTGWE